MVYGSWCKDCKTDCDVSSDHCDLCKDTQHAQPQSNPVASSSHLVIPICGMCKTECMFYSVYCGGCNKLYHETCENLSPNHLTDLKHLPVNMPYLCKRCCGHPFDFQLSLHRVYTAMKNDLLLPAIQLEKILMRDVKPLSDRDGRVYYNYKIDKVAEGILNRFIKNSKLTPVEVDDNGNCVYNSGSFYLFGHQGCAAELRLRTVIELVDFFAFYILEPRNKLLNSDFLQIIKACCTNHQPSPVLVLHPLSTVIRRPIKLIYPFNPMTDIKYYCLSNRKFESRVPTQQEPIYLMCSLGSQSTSHQWNHVVPVLSKELLTRQKSPQHLNTMELSKNAPYSTKNTLGLNALYEKFEHLSIAETQANDDALFVNPNIGHLKVGAPGSDPLHVSRTLRQIPRDSPVPSTMQLLLPPQTQKLIKMKKGLARKDPYSLRRGGSQDGRIQTPGASRRGISLSFIKNKKQIPQPLVRQVKIRTQSTHRNNP